MIARCRAGAVRLRLARLGVKRDTGSALVEFVLVAPLILLCFAAVAQVILFAHVKATLVSAASEGARAGANAGVATSVAVRRTQTALDSSAVGSSAQSITAVRSTVNGNRVVEVRVRARVPLFGLLGPTSMEVKGHALREG
ncbi:MAG: TadE family protein [Candidatus Nanopelagicales bacterium]